MKRTFFIGIILIVTLASFKTDKKWDTPPGTKQIGENLFLDETEVRNADWREYMYWNKIKYGAESKEYLSTIPDTSVWDEKNLQPFMKHYLRHPSYKEYPVVGISYQQAVDYCNWRSDRVNENIYISENKLKPKEGEYFEDVPEVYRYRLPSKEEWESVAEFEFSKKNEKVFDKKKNVYLSKYNTYSSVENDSVTYITAPAGSYWPNEKGIYNMIGNVAEMVQEKETAKGGSWKDKLEDIDVKKDFKYEGSTNWAGFRCICEKRVTK